MAVRLSERTIAEAALRLIDTDGVDGLSMRKLSQELGVTPMAIYHHFHDREAVLDGVTQLLLAQIQIPGDELAWKDALRVIMHSVRDVGLAHPKAAPLISRFPPRTPDALAFVEAGFRAFRRGGFDAAATARCYRALVVYSLGSFDVELGGYFTPRPAMDDAADAGSLDAGTSARHLPNVGEVGALLLQQDPADEFTYGLELMLTGLEEQATR